MKITVSSSDLLKHLQLASGAIGTNPVLPILEDFLFHVIDNVLHIAATDLETSILTQLVVKSNKNGMVAIPAKILLDTLKQLPQQPITIDVNDDNFGIVITSSFGKYKLPGENGADFPKIPKEKKVESITFPASHLQDGIQKTLFATSNDDLRPAMTGVLFQLEKNKITFVSTDAHKLVRKSFEKDLNHQFDQKFIIPKKALTLLKNGLPKEGDVQLHFNDTNAFFTFESTKMICRLIDARYPDYNAVIPNNNPNVLTVNRLDLQRALKRISIYSNKTSNLVLLHINEGSLTLATQDLDFSNEATEQMSATYTGTPLSIGFNARFLIEMLGILEGEEVNISLSTSTNPGILTPSEENEGEDLLMLVTSLNVSPY